MQYPIPFRMVFARTREQLQEVWHNIAVLRRYIAEAVHSLDILVMKLERSRRLLCELCHVPEPKLKQDETGRNP